MHCQRIAVLAGDVGPLRVERGGVDRRVVGWLHRLASGSAQSPTITTHCLPASLPSRFCFVPPSSSAVGIQRGPCTAQGGSRRLPSLSRGSLNVERSTSTGLRPWPASIRAPSILCRRETV